MAILTTANHTGKYTDPDAKEYLIGYITQPQKAIHGLIGGCQVAANSSAQSMSAVSEHFGKSKGVQLRHYIISFSPEELTDPLLANTIGNEISAWIGLEYQVVFAVHENRPHLHLHFIVNTVSYLDGHRWHGTRREFYQLKNAMAAILRKHNIHPLIYVKS